jgi:hypothetical protein
MFVCARRSKLLPDGAPLDQGELRLLADELRRAADFAREFRGTMIRTPDARVLWHDVYPELSAGGDGAFGAVTARAEAQVLRLSVIYALADQARAVDVEHLRAALAVWSYCEASAGYIFGQTLGDPLADRFHAALRHAGESGLTRTEIRDLAGGHVLSRVSRTRSGCSSAGASRVPRTSLPADDRRKSGSAPPNPNLSS